MATLILTCSTGQGHNSCASAIAEYYSAQGEVCDIQDALAFVSKTVSQAVCWGHVTIYRHFHSLFQMGYQYSEKHSGVFGDGSGIYHLLTCGAERIRDHIINGKYDQVVCTHVFASLMMTEVQKRYRLPLVTSLVATDYTCNPGTKESVVDRYFIPDTPLSVYYECPSISDEQIVTSGIPIRQMFYKTMEKSKAKALYRIPQNHRHLLMMCGSMGCGPMKKLTDALAKQLPAQMELTVVCGTNKSLMHQLARKHGNKKNIHIAGYVKNMSQLMDSADLYLTKPGGISVTEASSKNLPMVFIDAVAGCEAYNKIYFIRRGAAKTAVTVREIAELCIDILEKPRKLTKMRRNLEAMEKHNAAQIIYEEMERIKKSDPVKGSCDENTKVKNYAPNSRYPQEICNR